MSTKVINQPDLKIFILTSRAQLGLCRCRTPSVLQFLTWTLHRGSRGAQVLPHGSLGTWGGWSCEFWDTSLPPFCGEVVEPVHEWERNTRNARLGSEIARLRVACASLINPGCLRHCNTLCFLLSGGLPSMLNG